MFKTREERAVNRAKVLKLAKRYNELAPEASNYCIAIKRYRRHDWKDVASIVLTIVLPLIVGISFYLKYGIGMAFAGMFLTLLVVQFFIALFLENTTTMLPWSDLRASKQLEEQICVLEQICESVRTERKRLAPLLKEFGTLGLIIRREFGGDYQLKSALEWEVAKRWYALHADENREEVLQKFRANVLEK